MTAVTTSDPVDLPEISIRIGVSRDRLSAWLARGKIMQPHWRMGNQKGIWAWELLQDDPKIKEVLGGGDWSPLLDSLPPGIRYWVKVLETKDEFRVAQRWMERHSKGYAVIPMEGDRALMLTEKRRHVDWGERVDYETARARAEEALQGIPALRRAADARDPMVSKSWR